MGELIWTGSWKPHPKVVSGCHGEAAVPWHIIYGGTKIGTRGEGVLSFLPVDQPEFMDLPQRYVIHIIDDLISGPTSKF